MIDQNEDRLLKPHQELAATGKHLYFIQDLPEYDKLEGIISNSVSQIGKIDGLIHCAGISPTLPLRSINHQHLEKIFAIHVFAAIELAKLLSKKTYVSDNGSSLVFISSIMGILGEAGKISYCCSKSALISAAKAMALELAAKKIRVNCVLPAVVETEMAAEFFKTISEEAKKSILEVHPLGLGKPEDIAYACVFLLSDASRWVTGTSLIVDGGYSAK